MGEENMKVLSAVIAAAVASDASWDGVSADNTCGMVISGDNFVNKTCTVTGSSMEYIFAGNGAFINGDNTFTGYDGTSSDVNVVVFFSQSADADGNLDNSTCWDAPSHALIPALTTPDLSSWRTSTTTATPRTATTTSRSPTLTTVTFSPSS